MGVLPLGQHLCFALYTASRTVINRYRPLLDEIGITYPQYLVLLVLWERGDTTVRDLGTALQLDSSTLSPLLKRMEAAGIVTRSRLATDERSVLVSLTPHGSALRDRAEPIATAVACEFDLSLEELVGLRDALHKVSGHDTTPTHHTDTRGDPYGEPVHR
jgi:DNA-binding MarR family transcriptional regulator